MNRLILICVTAVLLSTNLCGQRLLKFSEVNKVGFHMGLTLNDVSYSNLNLFRKFSSDKESFSVGGFME